MKKECGLSDILLTNDSDVIRLIKAHIKELADDLGSEIATMLSEAYENTPVTT